MTSTWARMHTCIYPRGKLTQKDTRMRIWHGWVCDFLLEDEAKQALHGGTARHGTARQGKSYALPHTCTFDGREGGATLKSRQ